MFNLDPLKKARNVFRENLRKHNIVIKKKREKFELQCSRYSAKATTVDEIVAILGFMTRGSRVVTVVLEKYLELCATPEEIMNCACKMRRYIHVPVELYVATIQKLNDALLSFIDSAQSREELDQVWREVRFLEEQVHDSNSKSCKTYQLLHLKKNAQIQWSLRLARFCATTSELEEYRYICSEGIYRSRFRLLCKMESGHAPDSPRAKKRRMSLF